MVSSTTPATSAAPSGATTTFTYDPAGNKLTGIDPDQVTVTWTYTPLGKVATVSYSGSSAHPVSNSYDASGNRTGMTDATGTSSYSYDPFGELTSATNGASQATGYGYDTDGHTTSITYPLPADTTWANSSTVSYGYDHSGQLTSATDFKGNTIAIANTADGRPSSATLGTTNDTLSTTYDNTDEPSQISLKNSVGSSLLSFQYSDGPRRQHPVRNRYPRLFAITGNLHLRCQVAGHFHDTWHWFHPELQLRSVGQPHLPTDRG